jgi:hypothetical protein
MANSSIVASERYLVGGNRYDLSVHRTGEKYYASWFCEYCPLHDKGPDHPDQQSAYEEGVSLIKTHHAECHG